MATFLAYSSPATGHVFPMIPGLLALQERGHGVHFVVHRPVADHVRAAGLDVTVMDDRIPALGAEDFTAGNGAERLAKALQGLMSRGELEIAELRRAIERVRPDALLIDSNAYGAAVAAQASGLPWAISLPSLLPYPGRGIPAYGLGMKPMTGPVGRVRDALLTRMVIRTYGKAMLPRLNELRAQVGLAPLSSPLGHFGSTDRVLVLTGDPLEYPRVDVPANVRFVGAQLWDAPAETPAWLDEPGDPWVLVTCSTEYQGDEALAAAAIEALRDEPVRVIVTLADAHGVGELPQAGNARIERFVPHGPVLERAAAVVCHGGMGIVQKAIGKGVPIAAVPFGRDQPEVGRRITEAGVGVVVRRKDLSAASLRGAVRQALALRPEAKLSGGPTAFADAADELVLEAHGDLSLIR
jgi:MGT family glycosyltransferase